MIITTVSAGRPDISPTISSYLAELSAALRGPQRLRAELVLEARSGLLDAVADLQDAGWSDREAEQRAIAEFGSARELAAEFQPSIASRTGRRVALIGGLLPVLMIGWASSWTTTSHDDGSPFLYWLVNAIYLIGGAITVVCVLGLLSLNGRRALDHRLATRCRWLALLWLSASAALATTAAVVTTINLPEVISVMGRGLPLVVALLSAAVVPGLCWASVSAARAAPRRRTA